MRLVLGVHLIPDKRTSRFVYLYQPSVHHRCFYSRRFYLPEGTGLRIVTNSVVLVEVYNHEVLGQGLQDLHVAPLFRIDWSKMHLNDDLVDPLEHVNREVLESLVLSSLNIDLQNPVFIGQVVPLDHILEGEVNIGTRIFSHLTNTVRIVMTSSLIGCADGLFSVGAVVHVVMNFEFIGDVAAKRITTFNSNVDHSFSIPQEVFADNISTFTWSTIPGILAICVLNKYGFTL